MPRYEFSRSFLKDVKRWRKAGKDMRPFEEFLRIVQTQWPPPLKYEAHLLLGPFSGIWDIHLRQNWILLVRFELGTIWFLRMRTHAELGL